MHYSGIVFVYGDREVQKQVAKQLKKFEGEKWDWWQIGGRWTGRLDGYDPEKDPKNIEVCSLCHGTGKRDDQLGKAARAKDPNYNCNGCDGLGSRARWPSEWVKHTGDVQPVEKVTYIPFFVVDNGIWIEKSTIVDEDPAHERWVREIYKKHAGKFAVLIDVHN